MPSPEVGLVGDLHGVGPGVFELKQDNLVFPFGVEDSPGEIECLLRAFVPEPAEVEAVDPDIPFCEPVEADEALPFRRRAEEASEEFGVPCGVERPVDFVDVVEGERGDREVHEELIVEHDGGDALAVAEMLAVIDPAHGVDEDAHGVTLVETGNEAGVPPVQRPLGRAVESLSVRAVEGEIRPVMHPAQGQNPRAVVCGQHRFVVYEPEILPVLFHAKRHGRKVPDAYPLRIFEKPRTLGEPDLADVLQHGSIRQNIGFYTLLFAH